MNLEERKRVEDSVSALLDSLTIGEKAVLYKTLYAEGIKIADCDDLIRKASPPVIRQELPSRTQPASSQLHLPRGWPVHP